MTETNSSGRSIKVPRELEENDNETDGDESRLTKAKRHDIEVPSYEADIKLAEKLDHLLSISDVRKPRFFLNKPNKQASDTSNTSTKESSPLKDIDKSKLVPKNLTKEELKERLVKKYDTLVPELNPERPTVKLIKVLSAKESLELGKAEAKKQLVHQLELNSVSGNSQAYTKGTGSFRFNDGYELPTKCFLPGKKTALMLRKPKVRSVKSDSAGQEVKPKNSGKSVKFSDKNVTHNVSRHGAYAHNYDDSGDEQDDEDDDDLDDDEEDDLTDDDESDCSTTTASSENEKTNGDEKLDKD